MKLIRKYKVISALLFCIIIYCVARLVKSTIGFKFYNTHIFLPYQTFRNYILNDISFSVGDILYIILLFWFIYLIVKIIKNLINYKLNKKKCKIGIIKLSISVISLYFLFLISWGINYDRKSIVVHGTNHTVQQWTKDQLLGFLDQLIVSLNSVDTISEYKEWDQVNSDLSTDYKHLLGQHIPNVKTKPTLYGSLISYAGIQGYYNPFTGEAQVMKSLPKFMWGFVMAHEMAHQLGVASEGEANFLAYVICAKSEDKTLNYSASINLFLYAIAELKYSDAAKAKEYVAKLNTFTQQNLILLRKQRLDHDTRFRKFSNYIYDHYLQNQGVKKGLGSYREMTRLVFEWHQLGEPDPIVYR